jgi:hypothetical protein
MGRKTRGHRAPPSPPEPSTELLFVERASRSEPIVVEVDRPQAFRPRLVGFWLGGQFYLILKVAATRREHDALYHRLVTDGGAFEIRRVRVMDRVSLRSAYRWELCAELDVIPIARPG